MNRKSILRSSQKMDAGAIWQQERLTLLWQEVAARTPPVLYTHSSFCNYITMKWLLTKTDRLLFFSSAPPARCTHWGPLLCCSEFTNFLSPFPKSVPFEGQPTTVFLLGKSTNSNEAEILSKWMNKRRSLFEMARIPLQLHFHVEAFGVKSAGWGSSLRLRSRSISLQILEGLWHSNSGESMCLTELDAECQSVAASQSNYHTPVVNKRRVNILFCVNSFSCPALVCRFTFIWGEKRKFLWMARFAAVDVDAFFFLIIILRATLKKIASDFKNEKNLISE